MRTISLFLLELLTDASAITLVLASLTEEAINPSMSSLKLSVIAGVAGGSLKNEDNMVENGMSKCRLMHKRPIILPPSPIIGIVADLRVLPFFLLK